MPIHYLNQCCLIVNWTLRILFIGTIILNMNISILKHEITKKKSHPGSHHSCNKWAFSKYLYCGQFGQAPTTRMIPALQLGHPLQWRHNERGGASDHRRLECLLNRLFRCRSKQTSKLRVTDFCEGNSPVTSEFPAQRASNAENVSIWLRHHAVSNYIPIALCRCKCLSTPKMQYSICIVLVTNLSAKSRRNTLRCLNF